MCARNYAVQAIKGVITASPPHAGAGGWVRSGGYTSFLLCHIIHTYKMFRKMNLSVNALYFKGKFVSCYLAVKGRIIR